MATRPTPQVETVDRRIGFTALTASLPASVVMGNAVIWAEEPGAVRERQSTRESFRIHVTARLFFLQRKTPPAGGKAPRPGVRRATTKIPILALPAGCPCLVPVRRARIHRERVAGERVAILCRT